MTFLPSEKISNNIILELFTELNNYLDYEPGEATCNLMKMSFNENYRRIICSLGNNNYDNDPEIIIINIISQFAT